MALYEYRCECEEEREVLLPSPTLQVCKCGRKMELRMSVCSFVMKSTGRQMAMDSLNSKSGGMPNSANKGMAQQLAGRGL